MVYNQYRITMSQQDNLQKRALVNNINNRITAVPDIRLEDQNISERQIDGTRIENASPSLRKREVAGLERRLSNSLTVGHRVTRSSSLREPRLRGKVGFVE